MPVLTNPLVDDLVTLSGVAAGETDLGTFTGSTIGDDLTIKAALQALETAFEGLGDLATEDDWITETTGSDVLASNFDITATSTTFQATNCKVTLPAAGTYLVWYNTRGAITDSAMSTAAIAAKLRNTTDNADIAGSFSVACVSQVVNAQADGTATVMCVVTVAASKVIELWVARVFSTATLSRIVASGYTAVSYVRIG